MSSRKRNSLIMLIIVAVLAVAIIISLVLLILQRTGLEKITINPTFADTELDVNMDYILSVNTDPSGANIKKFSFEADSSSVTFEYKDDNTAILHTNGEGAVTVYVKKGKIESNKLTFQIVDKAAQAAAAQAAADAQAEQERLEAEQASAEAEQAAEVAVTYIRCIKDDVNIRSMGSTDGDILGKAKKGDTFELISDNGEWTEFKYGEQSGFMRNDMIETVAEGEDVSASEPQPQAEAPKQEEKKEEKKEEKPAEQAAQPSAEEQAAAEAKKAEEAAKKAAEEEAKKAAEAAQAAAELAAQQAATAATGALPASGAWIYQGKTFTAKQVAYFHAKWDYTGDAAEMVTHHSAGELQQAWEFDHPGEMP